VLNGRRTPNDLFTNLKTSMERFNLEYERKEGKDQFIDNIFALDALFSMEEDKDDRSRVMTVRFSKHLAFYLETDIHKIKGLFCDMVRLYDQRSEIIHGGYTQEYNVTKTREYLIKCYLKYFDFLNDDDFSHTKFIKDLDAKAKKFPMKRKDCQVKHTQ
jgi:hypothetical protein